MSRLDAAVQQEREALAAALGRPPEDLHGVVSPYRICPVGAHSDHQGGPVLGMTIDRGTVFAWAPTDDGRVELESANFPGPVRFDAGAPGAADCDDWSLYGRAAATLIRDRCAGTPGGLRARLRGDLPGGGLSSSASVSLGYLRLLAARGGAEVPATELVSLARRAENDFVGVACGILDPASIVGGRRDHLIAIDTLRESWEPVPLGAGAPAHRFLVVDTGRSRHLAGTGFNRRVEECHEAARLLAAAAGRSAERLGDLPDELFEAHAAELPEALRRRAAHFFGERARVGRGLRAWREGRLADFGGEMHASCRSSIECYETGSPELVRLQEILLATPGVWGSRFSGAGFGGCAVALVAADAAAEAGERVLAELTAAFPELAEAARAFPVHSDDGLRDA